MICFFVAIVSDMNICRKYHPLIFKDVFPFARNIPTSPKEMKHWGWSIGVLVAVSLSLTALFDLDQWLVPVMIFFILVAPIYLLRRGRFLSAVKLDEGKQISAPGERCEFFRLKSDAMGIVLMWFLSIFILSFVTKGVVAVWPAFESELGELLITVVVSSALILMLIDQASRGFSDKGFFYNVGFRKENGSFFTVVFVPLFIGLLFAWIAAYLLLTRQIQPHTPLDEIIKSTRSSGMLLAFVAMAILVAPLVEEVIFRGYFFHVIRKIRGQRFAVIFIALVFAALHFGQYWGDWLAIGVVTFLGFALTIMRAVSGTTMASVVLHYTYNTGVIIIPVIMMLMTNPPYFEYRAYFPYHDAVTKERLLKASIEKQPNLAEAYNDLAWLYAEENRNLDEAFELIEIALRVDPENYVFVDTKAEVFFKLMRYEESIAIREDLLKQDLPDKEKEYQRQRIREMKESGGKWTDP